MKSLVSTEWLDKNLENVRIFDASGIFLRLREMHFKNIRRVI